MTKLAVSEGRPSQTSSPPHTHLSLSPVLVVLGHLVSGMVGAYVAALGALVGAVGGLVGVVGTVVCPLDVRSWHSAVFQLNAATLRVCLALHP